MKKIIISAEKEEVYVLVIKKAMLDTSAQLNKGKLHSNLLSSSGTIYIPLFITNLLTEAAKKKKHAKRVTIIFLKMYKMKVVGSKNRYSVTTCYPV